MGSPSTALGQLAEQRACRFLEAKGFRLLAQNFSCAMGEIDLIMQHKDEIVFVEVRTRHNADYGSAVESVHLYKQNKLVKTATYYLQKKGWFDKVDCRFDVIGINPQSGEIEWVENAFEPQNF